MKKIAAFLGSKSGLGLSAAMLVAGTAGYLSLNPAPRLPQIAALPAPAEAPQSPAATPETPAAPDATPTPPRIDEVRLQPGGIFVVAGRAAPGSLVAVMLDGIENTTAQTGGDGAFAAVSLAEPSPEARVLTIVQRSADGELAGLGEVILAPIPAPEPEPEEVAAEAAPAPEVETTALEPSPEAAPQSPPPEPAPETQTAALDLVPEGETSPASETVSAAPETQSAMAEPEPRPAVLAPEPEAPQVENPSVAQPDNFAHSEPESPKQKRVAILRSSPEGVTLANPGPAPEVMSSVALDTISYSDDGDVQLSGRAQPEAQVVRVYLDNRAVAELPVDDSGAWRGELPNVGTGVYTLRIDELEQTGAVVSRVETPFKREDPRLLKAAADPSKLAQAITVQSGATLWAIARERYGEGLLYVRVFEANRGQIRDPDLIYPGQVFALPD